MRSVSVCVFSTVEFKYFFLFIFENPIKSVAPCMLPSASSRKTDYVGGAT